MNRQQAYTAMCEYLPELPALLKAAQRQGFDVQGAVYLPRREQKPERAWPAPGRVRAK